MKRFLLATILSLFTCASAVYAQYPGLSCDDPIMVDTAFQSYVPSTGTYWFSAWTYDLPMTVLYVPASGEYAETTPIAEVDFTCIPGVYEDSILGVIFNDEADTRVEHPIRLTFDKIMHNGQPAYSLSIGKKYRDMMSVVGVSHDVQAFVKVTVEDAGPVELVPDTAFRDCMNNTRTVALGDTLTILPNDTLETYMLNYSDWQEDSIRFVWQGSQPLRVWLGIGDCNYAPTAEEAWDYFDVPAHGTYKMTSQDLKDAINEVSEGFFYAKMLTTGAGYLIIEEVPEREPEVGTTALQYGQSIALAANDSRAFYMTRKAWTSATSFESAMEMQYVVLSKTAQAAIGSADILAVNPFYATADGWAANFTTAEMTALWEATWDNFIYVRFVSDAASVTPVRWSASDCQEHSTLIRTNTSFDIEAGSSTDVYRLRYEDIQGDSLLISWTGSGNCQMYVADTCVFKLVSTNKFVTHNKTISGQSTAEYSPADVAAWSTKRQPDADGFYYVRFSTAYSGALTFRSTKAVAPIVPEDTIPAEPVCPEVQSIVADTTVCDTLMPYTWYGHVFSAAATYRDTLRTPADCDSIIRVLTLSTETCVRPCPTPRSLVADTTVCDTLLPITWRGHVFAAAGTYRDTLRNEEGCDILYRRLRLTTVTCLRPEPEEDDTTTIVPTPDVPLLPTTVQVTCPSDALADVNITVTEEQPLYLYDQYGNLIWQQVPAVPGVTYTVAPQCGVKYTLRGKKNTIKIVR